MAKVGSRGQPDYHCYSHSIVIGNHDYKEVHMGVTMLVLNFISGKYAGFIFFYKNSFHCVYMYDPLLSDCWLEPGKTPSSITQCFNCFLSLKWR